jgi:hypothetical protein
MSTEDHLRAYYALRANEFEIRRQYLGHFTTHRLSIGECLETLLRDFLHSALYPRFRVVSGFFYDPKRGSQQHDILVVDHDAAPPTFQVGSLAVVPPHIVRAQIEVKSHVFADDVKGIVVKSSDAQARSGGNILSVGFAFPESSNDERPNGARRTGLRTAFASLRGWRDRPQPLHLPNLICAGSYHVAWRVAPHKLALYEFDRKVAIEALCSCLDQYLYRGVVGCPLIEPSGPKPGPIEVFEVETS